jgi:hypothetical protein
VKYRVLKKQHISKMCFVCDINNDFGLHAKFYETDTNELVALINPSAQHQGYPGRIHRGIATTILDETIEFYGLSESPKSKVNPYNLVLYVKDNLTG